MATETRSTRFYVRRKLKVPLQVFYKANVDQDWSENTSTEDLTLCGIGFTLSRPVEPNHPIRFVLPMPKQFRLFDFGKEKYDIWGIIRYVRLIESGSPEQLRIMVGAALIGAEAPPSFGDPAYTYDLKPILRAQSLWGFREIPRRTGPYVRSLEERLDVGIKINLKTIGEEGQIVELTEGLTLNISESGMAFLTKLSGECPKYVLIETEDKTVALLAAIRAKFTLEAEDYLRLHVQFVSGKWSFA